MTRTPPTVRSVLAIVLGALGGLFLLFFSARSALFDWYRLPTRSMEPTIAENSPFIPVVKCAYQVRLPFTPIRLFQTGSPRRGDLVLIRNPDGNPAPFVKRIVALAGDTLEMKNEVVILNGEAQPLKLDAPGRRADGESTLLGHTHSGSVDHDVLILPDRPALRTFGPITVPGGFIFVLGDNRDESRDSRFFGARPISDLWGRVLLTPRRA